jgi:hypothetical protein
MVNDPGLTADIDNALLYEYQDTLDGLRDTLWQAGFQLKVIRRTDKEYQTARRARTCCHCFKDFQVRDAGRDGFFCSHKCYVLHRMDNRL